MMERNDRTQSVEFTDSGPRDLSWVRRLAGVCCFGAAWLAHLGWISSAELPAAIPSPGPPSVESPAPPPAETAGSGPAADDVAGTQSPAVDLGPTNANPVSSAPQRSLIPGAEVLLSSNLTATAVQGREQKEQLRILEAQLDTARQLRIQQNFVQARENLAALLTGTAPGEIKRGALLEQALLAVDMKEFVRAQHLFTQYVQLYSLDPAVPEVLLRQGLLYRQMGAPNLALAKFYAVMTTALNLKLEKLDYYQRLVLQAQTEIADTFYLQGKYDDAADFFQRLLRLDSAELNKTQIEFKLIRSLSARARHAETAAQAQAFLERHPGTLEAPEARFLLASALKQMGRNTDALRQVLLLLEGQQKASTDNPEAWIYWQQRAGNEIANQLYREGDYVNALEIYLGLAGLNPAPSWQLPVWYQIGLVYERLRNPKKSADVYQRILSRKKELDPATTPPSLLALVDMAEWRAQYLNWLDKTESSAQRFQSPLHDSPAPPDGGGQEPLR